MRVVVYAQLGVGAEGGRLLGAHVAAAELPVEEVDRLGVSARGRAAHVLTVFEALMCVFEVVSSGEGFLHREDVSEAAGDP